MGFFSKKKSTNILSGVAAESSGSYPSDPKVLLSTATGSESMTESIAEAVVESAMSAVTEKPSDVSSAEESDATAAIVTEAGSLDSKGITKENVESVATASADASVGERLLATLSASSRSVGSFKVLDGYVRMEEDKEGDQKEEGRKEEEVTEEMPKQEFNGVKGEMQPLKFKDLSFAILFWAHIALVFYLIGVAEINGGIFGNAYVGLMSFVLTCAIFSIAVTYFSYRYMLGSAESVLKKTIFTSIVLFFCTGVVGLVVGETIMCVLGIGGFIFGVAYANSVKKYIPFTAKNVSTGIRAIRSSRGVFISAFVISLLGVIWTMILTVGGISAYEAIGPGTLIIFLFSYYWVLQTLEAMVQIVTASLIGEWWHYPDEEVETVSLGLTQAMKRACTYSFGSASTGGLLFAFVQALRQIRSWSRTRVKFVADAMDCLLGIILFSFDYVNAWAYVYIGIYGYSYSDAGKNVATMLQRKGWTGVISSELAGNAFIMAKLAVGLFTGFIGLILSVFDHRLLEGIGLRQYYDKAGFIIGVFVGFMVSSVILAVVSSALNSVIVRFAESPLEFAENHPSLSRRMESAWRSKISDGTNSRV